MGLLVDGAISLILALLRSSRLWLRPFSLATLFGGAVGCATGRVLNLDILLDPEENVSHFGDFVLHQVLVERVGDLQPTDERCGRNFFIAVIYPSHLALK